MALVHDTGRSTLERTEEVSSGTAQNVQTIRRSYEAFGRGDIPAVLAMLDEGVEWNMAEHHTFWPGGSFIGPQEVVEGVFMQIMQTFDGFTVSVDRVVGCGDTVLAQLRYRGVTRATGEALDAQAAHIFDFSDGKVVRYQQYTDTRQFADVTGVSPRE